MDVRHKDGDIFKGDETFKVHQVNCKGAMGAGIARQVRNDYPEVYDSYKNACDKVKSIAKRQTSAVTEASIADVIADLEKELQD